MNYLDLLPDDVMKNINRKLHDLQIKHRNIERKENQRKMIEQQQIAVNKKRIYNKFVRLYEQHQKSFLHSESIKRSYKKEKEKDKEYSKHVNDTYKQIEKYSKKYL